MVCDRLVHARNAFCMQQSERYRGVGIGAPSVGRIISAVGRAAYARNRSRRVGCTMLRRITHSVPRGGGGSSAAVPCRVPARPLGVQKSTGRRRVAAHTFRRRRRRPSRSIVRRVLAPVQYRTSHRARTTDPCAIHAVVHPSTDRQPAVPPPPPCYIRKISERRESGRAGCTSTPPWRLHTVWHRFSNRANFGSFAATGFSFRRAAIHMAVCLHGFRQANVVWCTLLRSAFLLDSSSYALWLLLLVCFIWLESTLVRCRNAVYAYTTRMFVFLGVQMKSRP